jgi:hypothetical protein
MAIVLNSRVSKDRLATAPNRTRLQTHYGTQAFYDAAVKASSETSIKLIQMCFKPRI